MLPSLASATALSIPSISSLTQSDAVAAAALRGRSYKNLIARQTKSLKFVPVSSLDTTHRVGDLVYSSIFFVNTVQYYIDI